jgi:hypothetical protein
MRTTVTLEPDVDALVTRAMRERGLTFKQAINEAIRAGLGRGERQPFRTAAKHLGRPAVPLDKALQLAAELEDEQIMRRMSLGP